MVWLSQRVAYLPMCPAVDVFNCNHVGRVAEVWTICTACSLSRTGPKCHADLLGTQVVQE